MKKQFLLLIISALLIQADKILSQEQASPDETEFQKPLSPFFEAVGKGDIPEVEKFIKQDPTVINQRGAFGSTALMLAAAFGNIPMIKLLVENKADVNAKSVENQTPLILAIVANGEENLNTPSLLPIVQYLVQNGADLQVKDKEGKNALDYAEQYSAFATLLRSLNPSLGNVYFKIAEYLKQKMAEKSPAK